MTAFDTSPTSHDELPAPAELLALGTATTQEMTPRLRFDGSGEFEAFVVLATARGRRFVDIPSICARDLKAAQDSWQAVADRARELEATAAVVAVPMWVAPPGNVRPKLNPERVEVIAYSAFDASGYGPQKMAVVARTGKHPDLTAAFPGPRCSHFDTAGPLIAALGDIGPRPSTSAPGSVDLGRLFREPDSWVLPCAADLLAQSQRTVGPALQRGAMSLGEVAAFTPWGMRTFQCPQTLDPEHWLTVVPELVRSTETQTLGSVSLDLGSRKGEHQLSLFALDADGVALHAAAPTVLADGRPVEVGPWQDVEAPAWTKRVSDALARNRDRRQAFETVDAPSGSDKR